jgi:hypothetical protein
MWVSIDQRFERFEAARWDEADEQLARELDPETSALVVQGREERRAENAARRRAKAEARQATA